MPAIFASLTTPFIALTFNQNWCEYTGLTLEQSLGSGWLTALHPDDIQSADEIWSNAVKNKTIYNNEYRFKRAFDGSYRWQLARGFTNLSRGKVRCVG
ncbi:PAS domain-containing protein [Nostoc sp. JL33]|uniref:PAS domain-containing protein n=1 Tax=Nostoc sp. JL33 TaxID=2815396 RepID=UPI0025D29867|nr:PAS domain-containing protein [Nostoc sp. JL33]MBN3873020.1 PAS domain-containing protein [Nostoc sp. JL33]